MVNKMKKLQIYRFNLVEIMLAIVILALGMTSVFVLFPAGLNNHKSAMAENSFADLAEFIVSRIRSDAALSSNEAKFTYDLGDADDRADALTYCKSNIYKEGDSGWTKVDDGGTLLKNNTHKGIFVARQLSGPPGDQYADFTAVARVYPDTSWKEDFEIPFDADSSGNVKKYEDLDKSKSGITGTAAGDIRVLNVDDFVLPLVVEISYPADKAYDDREKVYFRFEIFNESFELKVQP